MASRPDPDLEKRAAIAAHIHRMISTPDWDHFTAQVRELEQQHVESLITMTQDIRYEQGVIKGIREVMRLPLTLIAQGRRA